MRSLSGLRPDYKNKRTAIQLFSAREDCGASGFSGAGRLEARAGPGAVGESSNHRLIDLHAQPRTFRKELNSYQKSADPSGKGRPNPGNRLERKRSVQEGIACRVAVGKGEERLRQRCPIRGCRLPATASWFGLARPRPLPDAQTGLPVRSRPSGMTPGHPRRHSEDRRAWTRSGHGLARTVPAPGP